MPIYEYVCNTCHKSFALLQRMGATENETVCSECGSKDIRKKLSAFSCCQGSSGSSSPASVPSFGGGG